MSFPINECPLCHLESALGIGLSQRSPSRCRIQSTNLWIIQQTKKHTELHHSEALAQSILRYSAVCLFFKQITCKNWERESIDCNV